MANLKWLFLALAFIGGCAKNVPYVLHDKNQNAIQDSLQGEIVTSDSKTISLENSNDLPIVLIFSQDTCIVCAHEAEVIRDRIKNQTMSPSKIHLYTVLVGAYQPDAVDWKQAHHVFWDVAVDTHADLFHRYCAIPTVPCSIIQIPGKGIIFRRNGKVEFEEFINLTGPWED